MSSARAGGRGTTPAAAAARPPGADQKHEAGPGIPAATSGEHLATRTRGAGLARVAAWGPPAAAAAVMIVLSLWGLGRQGAMGNDEVVTRYAAMLSLPQLFHLLRHVDVVHGSYYVLMHAWSAIGTSPTALRIPSLIAMAAAAALIAVTCRRLTGSAWAGLFAGLITALTPSMSFYAQTARSYTMVQLGVVASTLALLRALDAEAAGQAGRRLARWWVLYALLMTITSYLNELALPVLAAHAATVLLTRYGRRAFEHFVIAAVACGVIVAPVVLLSVRQRATADWITRPDLRQVGILWHDYFGATNLSAAIVFVFALVALLPPRGAPWRLSGQGAAGQGAGEAGEPAVAWWNRRGVTLPSVAVPLVTLPAGLLMLESLVAHPLYVDRYVLYGEVGAALLAGAGCYRAGLWLRHEAGRRLRGPASTPQLATLAVVPGVIVVLCTLLLNLGPQQRARTPQSRQFDYGTPSVYIGAHAQAGDGILFFNAFYRKARIGYPADYHKVTDFAMAQSPSQAGNLNGVDKQFAAVEPVMLTYQRIWVLGRVPSPYLADPTVRAEAQLLMSRYHLVVQRHFKGMNVTLWQRT